MIKHLILLRLVFKTLIIFGSLKLLEIILSLICQSVNCVTEEDFDNFFQMIYHSNHLVRFSFWRDALGHLEEFSKSNWQGGAHLCRHSNESFHKKKILVLGKQKSSIFLKDQLLVFGDRVSLANQHMLFLNVRIKKHESYWMIHGLSYLFKNKINCHIKSFVICTFYFGN